MGVIRRGSKWCIRYYGPDGRQRWETIGPNKKEAETVLHQRLYEVRSGVFPILRRRSQITFRKLAEEWIESYAKAHVRPSTLSTYRWLLDYHLLPAFGDRALTTLTPKDIQVYLADKLHQVAPKTANHGLVLLKEILEAAVAWGRIPTNPAKQIRKAAVPTFASLLIMAGKHPKYICAQMGHHSAAFTLDTYGHLMERLPVRPVEWIDDLVFPQGAVVALKLHSHGALPAAMTGHAVQSQEWLKARDDAGSNNLLQSGTTGYMVGGAGLEPAATSV